MNAEIKKIELIKEQLINNSKSMMISVSYDGFSDIGYAPYFFQNNIFYIYSSELSSHIKLLLLKKTGTFMIIKDENDSQNIWARLRLKFDAKISTIVRDSKEFHDISDGISAKLGQTMNLIKQFNDFHLIKIVPSKGTIISGFGSAFNLKGASLKVVNKIKP